MATAFRSAAEVPSYWSWMSGGNTTSQTPGRLEFTGHDFVTTASINMNHGGNGIGVSMSRCRNFHKNTRNFTESYKSLKTNLILKNKIVSHLERGTHWVKHLAPLFVLWKYFYSYPIILSSKLKTFLLLESFQKSKTKKKDHYFWPGVYLVWPHICKHTNPYHLRDVHLPSFSRWDFCSVNLVQVLLPAGNIWLIGKWSSSLRILKNYEIFV